MKKHFIKIDLKSINKNPNAGSEIDYLPGKTECRFSTKKLPDDFIDGENCYVVREETMIGDGSIRIEGIITDKELIDNILQNKRKDIELIMKREIIEVRHLPEPPYFYDYENITLKCDSCNREFDSIDIKSEEVWDGENEFYSDRVCPYCNSFDCCEIDYETIEEALKRLELLVTK